MKSRAWITVGALAASAACSTPASKGDATSPPIADAAAPPSGDATGAPQPEVGADVGMPAAPDAGIDTSTPPTPDGGMPVASIGYQPELGFLAGGAAVANIAAGYTGSGYVAGFAAQGAEAITTLAVASAGTYAVSLRYSNVATAAKTLTLSVNGYRVRQASFVPTGGDATWATHAESLVLRAGLNTLSVVLEAGDSGGINLDAVLVPGGLALAARGATVPYVELEAESAQTTGTVVGPGRDYGTLEAEASGREAVRLAATGQSVSFTMERPANALVLRYSIPDSADGQGLAATLGLYVNGQRVRDLPLSSKYAWVYGDYPYDNTPGDGSPHRYFDELRADLGELPAGTVVKLQKDAADTVASVVVDLADFEEVPPAFAAPADFLSIADQGAVADDGNDDTDALNKTLAMAVDQKKGVFVPAGVFEIAGHINLAGVTLAGAGPWRSVLHGKAGKGGLFGVGGRIAILDLAIFGDVSYRDDQNFDTGIEGNFGSGSLIQNVWIEHTKVGMWFDAPTDGLYVVGARIRDTFADGVNIHKGTHNARVDQTNVRNTGDDGLAMFSEGQAVTACAYTFDTVQLPMLANTVGLYGGTDNRVEDDVLVDTVNASAGIAVSTRFAPVTFAGTTSVQRDTLTRTGGYEHNWGAELGAVWLYADASDIAATVLLKDLTVVDSAYQALLVSGTHAVTQVTIDGVAISGTGSYGIELATKGSATFQKVTVVGATKAALDNASGYTVVRGDGDTGF
jgi:Pectate lyase superfamily protein/Carbohydrate binding module (family 35)